MSLSGGSGAQSHLSMDDDYTIGITIFVDADGALNFFENGLRQNVFFLYEMFKASPHCKRVFFLNHGDGEPKHSSEQAGIEAGTIVRTPEVIDELDFVISIGATLDRETVQELKKRKIPIIAYKCGNGGVIAMEAMCADPPRDDAERYFDADYFDMIWMTPQHIHTYKGWCETVYRVPVHEVGQLWSPWFINQRPPEIRENYGYTPDRKTWRVGVLDPNITVMKTSHMPMLACEAAWRQRPEVFEAFYIANGLRYADNPHFSAFFNSMSAAQTGKMTLEPRFVGVDMIANHCDAVVTHQWENGLNYLYYEVLYGGYPLIHNSTFLKDCGYYYPEFDAVEGGKALLRAFEEHENPSRDGRAATSKLIESVSPLNSQNLHAHEHFLALSKGEAKAK